MSQFVNAKAGTKKIFAAVILEIIAAVCLFAGSLCEMLAATGENAESPNLLLAILGVVLMIAAFIVIVISFILNLIGLRKAGHDEFSISGAFWFAIAGIVVSVLGIVLPLFLTTYGTKLLNICNVLAGLFEIFIVIFLCQGLANLLIRIDQEKLAAKGRRTALVYAIIYAISKFANFFISSINGEKAQNTASIIILVVTFILEILAFIWYITFLGKAKKVL